MSRRGWEPRLSGEVRQRQRARQGGCALVAAGALFASSIAVLREANPLGDALFGSTRNYARRLGVRISVDEEMGNYSSVDEIK